MKRGIVEILADLQGGVVKESDGRFTLYYKTYEDGKYNSHHKDVTCIISEIEDTPMCVTEEPKPVEGAKMIGIKKDIRLSSRSLGDEYQWVFVSILQGILVEEATPVSPVYVMARTHDDLTVSITGFCYVTGGKKKLSYSKIEY